MSPKQQSLDPRIASLAADGTRILALRDVLCRWFEGASRDLPWRRSQDPYGIWISEAMLQQTRVEAVLGYYPRFLKRFPTFQALAAATEEEVVGMWSGLGYYNRARALRRAAQAIVEQHGSRFPSSRESARALPGVGDYTVGAVLSIAYGLGVPLVDGNVARVFARLFCIREVIDLGATRRLLWALAEILVPADHGDPRAPDAPGSWNQALMELGATLCRARSPRCAECPLSSLCEGRRAGIAEELPKRRPKRAVIDVRIEMFLARRGDQVLLVQRPKDDRMGGMWELPTRELESVKRDTTLLWPRLPHGPAGLVESRSAELLGKFSHAITHHRISAELKAADAREQTIVLERTKGAAWFTLGDLEGVSLTGLTRKALRKIQSP